MRRRRDVLGRLYVTYAEANERHFGGLLPPLPLQLDRASRPGRARVRTLAYLWTDHVGAPRHIVFDERMALTLPWDDLRDALLHEMVHVLQAVRGRLVTHDAFFRLWSRRLGISARAVD